MTGLTYQVTLYNYTNGDPPTDGKCGTDADRDTMRIWYGDGTSDVLVRSNGTVIDQGGYPGGVTVCDCRKINIYTNSPDGVSGGHTYPGAGTYHIWIDDQDRMKDIINIPNSVSEDFYLFTSITIGFAGEDISTPVITHPLACEYACTGQCYYYNLGAYSPTGDSISYALGDCLCAPGYVSPVEYGVDPAGGYKLPPGSTIDSTGTLKWCQPVTPGIYNFSIRIVSYKHTVISGTSYSLPIDTMDVELEIIVNSACTTQDPVITGPDDTCVVAGSVLDLRYTAKDTNGHSLTMSAACQSFTAVPPSTFTTTGSDPIHGQFIWSTNCSDVRNSPYQLTVKATDIDFPIYDSVSVYKTTLIHIVPPAPTGLTAKVLGNSVYLHWDTSVCPEVSGYQIYRAPGCVKFTPGYCETGVPLSSGYTYIGSTNNVDSVSFIDYSVIPGLNYSYLVIAEFPLPDGSLSFASNDTCVLVRRNLPLLINVSVDSTDKNDGKIYVRWIKPLADSGYLDTVKLSAPYTYKLYRAVGMNSTSFNTLICTVHSTFFGSTIDTAYKDTGLNTVNNSYRYKLDFYYNDSLPIGTSSAPPASSIFLDTKPGNERINLSWASNVPWNDSTYSIYRRGPGASAFNLLATVPGSVHNYTDSGITNAKTFCYYIKSTSFYADPSIFHPLYDSSEEQCNSPKDTTPPCKPALMVLAECNTFSDSLIWNNPDHFCPNTDDIEYYNILYSPTVNGDMQTIQTITNVNDTIFVNSNLSSVAGCYAVLAVDSAGNVSFLNTVCVDNCPQYTLPNVFTPNGDGQDDFFTPILPYRYIKNIDINIYNRWGQVMFHTNNPMINWDGKDQTSHGECPDGVYYYICTVNEIRVTGVQPVVLKGFLQLIR